MSTNDPKGVEGLMPIDPLLHYRTAARDYLGLSATTANRLIETYNVPVIRLGKKRMVRRSALVTLIDRIEQDSGVAA